MFLDFAFDKSGCLGFRHIVRRSSKDDLVRPDAIESITWCHIMEVPCCRGMSLRRSVYQARCSITSVGMLDMQETSVHSEQLTPVVV
jgi:hypothetical protein